MSDPGSAGAPPPGGDAPSEEELRAAYEAELSRISATDMIAQAAVSLLNIGARRLAPAGEPGGVPEHRDLDQAGDAIDAARALLAILERRIPNELGPLRDALSRLQLAYAAEVGGGGAPEAAPDEGRGGGDAKQEPPAGSSPPPAGEQRRPGPAESSGRLWVPGS